MSDDHFAEFVDSHCTRGEFRRAPFSELYDAYLEWWSRSFGDYRLLEPLSRKAVSRRLSDLGFRRCTINGWRHFAGIEPAGAPRRAGRLPGTMNTVGAFLDERCTTSARAEISARELYDAYCDWLAEAQQGAPATQTRFGRDLAEIGLEKTRTKSERRYRGVALNGDFVTLAEGVARTSKRVTL